MINKLISLGLNNSGWIKIHRQITEWEWWQDIPVKVLFLQMLIEANHEKSRWQGVEICPGQLIFGRKEMALRCGLSEQSVRTALDKLKSTSEITIKSTNKFSLITVNNWAKYQDSNQQTNQQLNQQSTNNQPTINHTIRNKEYKECKEVKNIYSADFDKFWNIYPNKRGKLNAAKIWNKLNQKDKDLILEVLPIHCQQEQWIKNDGAFIPHASTWLNGRRWEDEIVKESPQISIDRQNQIARDNLKNFKFIEV